ncbi:hypothetical protein ACQQ2Q_17915 [Agrobacterium sp. ES01]|uniref:hypothetical protein n=1 Tax=Agrobacterium sp. ES01 TaxID=3420714 RepID=UPI003D0D92B8
MSNSIQHGSQPKNVLEQKDRFDAVKYISDYIAMIARLIAAAVFLQIVEDNYAKLSSSVSSQIAFLIWLILWAAVIAMFLGIISIALGIVIRIFRARPQKDQKALSDVIIHGFMAGVFGGSGIYFLSGLPSLLLFLIQQQLSK